MHVIVLWIILARKDTTLELYLLICILAPLGVLLLRAYDIYIHTIMHTS